MKRLCAALRFLTILPVPARWAGDETDLNRGVPFFPVVGLLIGLLIASFDLALSRAFPPLLASTFVVVALIAVSGGLHLDGLADSADGLFSSRPREQVLEIMRDSRVGPMGVAAIVCTISLKIAAVSSIGSGTRWAAILLMPLAGRCALVILMELLPYARREGGLATVFQENRSMLHTVWAVGALTFVGWISAGSTGLAVAVVSITATLLLAAYMYSKIGGFTGDTLGAACEIVEVLPALVLAASSNAV